jgi:hypothetical protein
MENQNNIFFKYSELTVIDKCLQKNVGTCIGRNKYKIQGFRNCIDGTQYMFLEDESNNDNVEEDLIDIKTIFSKSEVKDIIKIMNKDDTSEHIYPLIRKLINLL